MATPISSQPARQMSTLEKSLLGVPLRLFPSLLPGLLAAVLLAWLSIWLSDVIGTTLLGFDKTPISAVMLAVLLGLIIGVVVPMLGLLKPRPGLLKPMPGLLKPGPGLLKPGLTFAVKKVLRLGIILLGIRLTVFDVFRLGVYGVPIVLLCISGALLITTVLSKRLALPERLGALIAVGTSICGVSAIVATGPAIDAEDEEVAYAVAVITIFGLFATIVYPFLANAIFGGEALSAGLFLGTSVHDTSQVVGAAKVYADVFSAPRALDVATVTKLVRNVFMAVVIPLAAIYYCRRPEEGCEPGGNKTSFLKLFPLFVLGFLAMAAIRSIGDAGINTGGAAFGLWDSAAWQGIHDAVKDLAGTLMVVALAGVGLSTDFRAFKGLGIKPFLAGLGAALIVGLLSYLAISLLGSFVAL